MASSGKNAFWDGCSTVMISMKWDGYPWVHLIVHKIVVQQMQNALQFCLMYSACSSLYRLYIQFCIIHLYETNLYCRKLIDSVEFVSPSDGMHYMSLHVRIGECEERCLNACWAEKGMRGATEPIRWTPVRGSERGVTGLMCTLCNLGSCIFPNAHCTLHNPARTWVSEPIEWKEVKSAEI